jgi:uncharacterized protein YggE
MNRRQIVLGLVVALAVVAVLLLGFALGRLGDDDATSTSRAITVTGTGKVEAVPDVAELSLGVSATAPSSSVARTQADTQVARVIAVLRTRGVADGDVRTSQISLTPNFDRTGSRVVGYTATNTVDATIRTLEDAGAIVAAAAAAGANQISGPTLTVSNEDAVYARALEAAVANARAHAEAIADANGDAVGELQTVIEGSSDGGPIPFSSSAKGADLAATPVEPGTLEVTASVTATFAVD